MSNFPKLSSLTIATTFVSLLSSGAVFSAQSADSKNNKVNALEEVVVSVHPLADEGLAQTLRILSGDELAEKVQGSLGETVAGEAGIQSASFGTAVGRPVIHGLGGARVKTTEDRIDSMDVSVTSSDHAVTIEPFIANKVNILKGASTLLYGTGAIGGVVDVETGRIPKEVPDKTVQGRLELRAADNSNAKTGAVRLDGAASENIAWHLDAFGRDADDYDIPGFAESAALRAAEEEEEAHGDGDHDEHEHEEEQQGTLLGSRLKNSGGAVGFSYVGDNGFTGIAVSKLDAQYGLIGGHEHEEEGDDHGHEEEGDDHDHEDGHEEEEAPGMIDMEQTRFDFESQLNNPFSGFKAVNFRLGVNDYQHKEIEGNGEIGTVFTNDAYEGRLELVHEEMVGFEGSFGVQLNNRKFSAIGEEAFVAPVETDTLGVFWVGQKSYSNLDLQTGVRYEKVKHKPLDSDEVALKFSTSSASLGLVIPLSKSLKVSTLLDYSSRAPTIEEVYSNGAHLATQSFEVGNKGLQKESAVGLTLTANYRTDFIDLIATAYHTDFSDFIYQSNSGQFEDDLPVRFYQQQDARFTGLDINSQIHLGHYDFGVGLGEGDFDLSLLFDTVRAELDTQGNANLPRTPATRYGAELSWSSSLLDAKIRYQRVSKQNRVADFEFASDAYNDVSVYLGREILSGDTELTLFFHGRNLTDAEQRHHTSFIKDLAPAPGRRFEVGLRLQF